jgi:hypothetical protein
MLGNAKDAAAQLRAGATYLERHMQQPEYRI